MEDKSLPQIVDISEPTAEEIQINWAIEEVRRRHAAELEPLIKRAVEARNRRQPKYVMIPGEGKSSFELETA